MNRLRDEAGFTLPEVLTVTLLSIVILGATLTTFSGFERNARANQLQNENQDHVRTLMGRQANELRNLASPQDNLNADQRKVLDKIGSYDIVFKTVDLVKPNGTQNERNIRRVRYCLQGGTTGPGTLYVQSQTWTAPSAPVVPPAAAGETAACPDPSTAWQSTKVAAQNITNRYGSLDRPIWRYNATNPLEITAVREELYVDGTPGKEPVESKLVSGVFLRNQNREPVSVIGLRIDANRRLVLNGSGSSDPEGKPLVYRWTLDNSTLPSACTTANASWCREGVTVNYDNVSVGTHTVRLTVSDGALSATAEEEVFVP
jgi:type II secretory pathway pseudopilin PulG